MSAQERRADEVLRKALRDLDRDPRSAGIIRDLSDSAPDAFALSALTQVLDGGETKACRFLLIRLAPMSATLERLTEQWLFSDQQAVSLARRLLAFDVTLDLRLAKRLPAKSEEKGIKPLQGWAAVRALGILDEISAGTRVVPILTHLVDHEDRQISSRAASLIGKRVQNFTWASRVVSHSDDPRIRANALESLWGNSGEGAMKLFRAGLEDTNNRVLGNALVGLHLAADPQIMEMLEKLVKDPRPEIRMTAAWAMGTLDDASLVPSLTPLIKDSDARVRSAALRALRGIHQSRKCDSRVEPIPVPETPVIQEAEDTLIPVESSPEAAVPVFSERRSAFLKI